MYQAILVIQPKLKPNCCLKTVNKRIIRDPDLQSGECSVVWALFGS